MKTKITNKLAMLNAARLALQIPGLNQLMDEVGQRMDRRDAAKRELAEPRKLRTIK